MMDVKKWIIDWFISEGEADENSVKDNLDTNYFTIGFIDSFKFINMIADIEEKYGIEFDNDQFEDRSFSTINGLTNVIERLINNGKS